MHARKTYFYLQVKYAGFSINCESSMLVGLTKTYFDCTCTDKQSNVKGSCKRKTSLKKSCRYAFANLIRKMVNALMYPATCDTLPKDCEYT